MWYRLPARIVVSDDGLCDIAPLGISMPHPSLINLALRRGVPHETRLRLFFLHEVGHLQTLPLLVVPQLLLRRKQRARKGNFLFHVLGLEAFWELTTLPRRGIFAISNRRKSPQKLKITLRDYADAVEVLTAA
jgi:hypothetical protein